MVLPAVPAVIIAKVLMYKYATPLALISAGYIGLAVHESRQPTIGAEQIKALKSPDDKATNLNEYEKKFASEIIRPDAIDVDFSDISGMDEIISSLQKYGPPGCGKTLLAKVLAKESGATFINVTASVLTSKRYGESEKLANALFSLARKRQPSFIFIDEIDSIFRGRSIHDRENTARWKAQIMILWDGLLSGSDKILILGATNRIQDIDPACLRRMPRRISVSLPNAAQRERILSLFLGDVQLAPDFSMRLLAERTEGLSGSDPKDLCQKAVMLPVWEIIHGAKGDVEHLAQEKDLTLRPLTIEDFLDGSLLQ